MHLDRRSQSDARRRHIDEVTIVDPDIHASDCTCDDCIYDTVQDPTMHHPMHCKCWAHR